MRQIPLQYNGQQFQPVARTIRDPYPAAELLLFTMPWCVQMLALRTKVHPRLQHIVCILFANIDLTLRETRRCLRTAYEFNDKLPMPVLCTIPEARLKPAISSLGWTRLIH